MFKKLYIIIQKEEILSECQDILFWILKKITSSFLITLIWTNFYTMNQFPNIFV